jgi:hypothetical protein
MMPAAAPSSDDGGQMTDDGRQMTEGRRQMIYSLPIDARVILLILPF